MVDFFQENEIIANAQAIKYHDIEYNDNYVVITQNRTRRRVPNGYYFEDTGVHIYVSLYYADIWQHKRNIRKFIVNTVSKEWRNVPPLIIETHVPERIEPIEIEPDANLIK